MRITTNNNRRRILDSSELTIKEAEKFDYLDWDKLREGTDSASFFRFRGEVYDLNEFMRVEKNVPSLDEFEQWDGYMSESYSSGILVKYAKLDNDDMLIVGTYLTG